MCEQPDVTLPELREWLRIDISVQTLSRALRALQLTFKKVLCASEQDRPDVHERRIT